MPYESEFEWLHYRRNERVEFQFNLKSLQLRITDLSQWASLSECLVNAFSMANPGELFNYNT